MCISFGQRNKEVRYEEICVVMGWGRNTGRSIRIHHWPSSRKTDAKTGEVLLLSLLGDAYCASFADSAQQWHDVGTIRFPIKACYPEVLLRNRAAHVLAIGDIVEPVKVTL
jgi:hypothetical protein